MTSFAEPFALVSLVLLAPALAAAGYAAARRRDADLRIGGSAALRRGLSPRRRGLREVLLLAAMALIAIAVARPTWGEEEVPVTRRGVDVAITLDISRSMTAGDVEPTRAGAAAAGLARMLEAMQGNRAGLVTFGGTAFARSPLTLDLEAVTQLVGQAQGEALLVQPGTDLAAAIEAAVTLLDVEDRADTRVIVLVSDGEHVGRDLEFALRRARDAGVRVFTVAAGTEAGAALPGESDGASEVTRADRETLRVIAEETGGSFRDVEAIAGLAVEFSRLRQTTFAGTEQSVPVERFQWFLGAALVLLLARELFAETAGARPLRGGRPVRRAAAGVPALLAVMVLAAACGTAAYRQVEDGNAAYEQERYEEALTAYGLAADALPDDPGVAYNTGNALHRLRRFEEAAVASERAVALATEPALRAAATYALGGHAFRRGDLEAARGAYVEVLRADPDDDDARHNLELVLLLQRGVDPAQPLPPPPAASEPGVDPGDAGGGEQQPGGGAGPGASPPPAGATPGDPGDAPGGMPGDAGDGTGSGGDQGSGSTTSPGQSPAPGAGPGDGGAGGSGAGSAPRTLEAVQAAIEAALAGLDEDVTREQALAILDQLRLLNSLAPLEGEARPGALPDR